MTRQPYAKVVPRPKGSRMEMGQKSIGQRPELEQLLSRCFMIWPFIESEMALFLGQLLGAENLVALAVFQALRRSSSQSSAISEAANVALNKTDQELLAAVLTVHKSVEAERNSLVHGHFGIASELPDALIWMSTNDYTTAKAEHLFGPVEQQDREKRSNLRKATWVYRPGDLRKIYSDMTELGDTWGHLLRYVQSGKSGTQKHAELYRQLCGQPRVAQELETLRRKNSR